MLFRSRLRRFEDQFGTKLLGRNPLRPLRPGWDLYHQIGEGMEVLLRALRNLCHRTGRTLRIGTDPALMECHLRPAIMAWRLGRDISHVHLVNDEPAALQRAVEEGRLDLAITFRTASTAPGLASQVLGRVPLVLLAPASVAPESAESLWKRKTIDEHLIAPTPGHPVARSFEKGLDLGGIAWMPRITLPSAVQVAPLVAAKAGMGVVPELEHLTTYHSIRVLPLHGFDPVEIVCLWRPADTRRLQPALRLLKGISLKGKRRCS